MPIAVTCVYFPYRATWRRRALREKGPYSSRLRLLLLSVPLHHPGQPRAAPPNHRKYRQRSSERTIYPPCHARPRLTACRQTFNSKRTEYSRCQRHASTISHSCHRVHDKSVACVGSEYGYTMSIVVLKALTPAHPRVNFVLVRYPPSVMKPHRLPPQPSRRPRLTGPSASPHRFASRRPRPSP